LPNLNEPKILWQNSLGIEELVNRRRIWAVKLKLSKEALTKKQLQVCSKHFSPNNYLPGMLLCTLSIFEILDHLLYLVNKL